jgi:hypothetical protein
VEIDTQTTKTSTAKRAANAAGSSEEKDYIDIFCRGTNAFFKDLTIKQFQNYVEIQPSSSLMNQTFFQKLISPPQTPGLPRPVWFTIAASVPTALGWYGYYKFSVEEELFHDEIQKEGRATGCGGYGTLLPFVFLFLMGGATFWIPPVSALCFQAGGLWILLGQVNLYRRVNEICKEEFGEEPLHSWWALLPPPLDVVVGLRQVHFLAKYWAARRGEELSNDVIAEELFPFIASERFTLKQFIKEPSRWFWFTKEAKDFDFL